MSHRIAMLLIALLPLVATPVLAQKTPTDQVITSLLSNGYVILTDERTWLGRQRIVAENGTYRREIVFNPATGEIYRDYTFELRFAVAPESGSSGSHSVGTGATQVDIPVASAGGPVIEQADLITVPEFFSDDTGLVVGAPGVLIIGVPTN